VSNTERRAAESKIVVSWCVVPTLILAKLTMHVESTNTTSYIIEAKHIELSNVLAWADRFKLREGSSSVLPRHRPSICTRARFKLHAGTLRLSSSILGLDSELVWRLVRLPTQYRRSSLPPLKRLPSGISSV
jgi:hypothetical protein